MMYIVRKMSLISNKT